MGGLTEEASPSPFPRFAPPPTPPSPHHLDLGKRRPGVQAFDRTREPCMTGTAEQAALRRAVGTAAAPHGREAHPERRRLGRLARAQKKKKKRERRRHLPWPPHHRHRRD